MDYSIYPVNTTKAGNKGITIYRAVALVAATVVLAAALFPTAALFHCAALTRHQMAGEWGSCGASVRSCCSLRKLCGKLGEPS